MILKNGEPYEIPAKELKQYQNKTTIFLAGSAHVRNDVANNRITAPNSIGIETRFSTNDDGVTNHWQYYETKTPSTTHRDLYNYGPRSIKIPKTGRLNVDKADLAWFLDRHPHNEKSKNSPRYGSVTFTTFVHEEASKKIVVNAEAELQALQMILPGSEHQLPEDTLRSMLKTLIAKVGNRGPKVPVDNLGINAVREKLTAIAKEKPSLIIQYAGDPRTKIQLDIKRGLEDEMLVYIDDKKTWVFKPVSEDTETMITVVPHGVAPEDALIDALMDKSATVLQDLRNEFKALAEA